MDALSLIIKMLSLPKVQNDLRDFLSENVPGDVGKNFLIKSKVEQLHQFMMSRKFRVLPGDEKQALIKSVRLKAPKVAIFFSEIVRCASRKQFSNSRSPDLVTDWEKTRDLIIGMPEAHNYSKHIDGSFDPYLMDFWKIQSIFEQIERIKISENMEIYHTNITLNEEMSRVLFLKKAFPFENWYPGRILNISYKLDNLPHLICKECEGQSLALLLIGGLLSLRPMSYDIWNRVKDDLVRIKESNNCVPSNNNMWHIINYCYDDLPYSLKLCFLYFSCYPIGYEIPATSLTDIWIADGIVGPNNVLEEEEEWVDTGGIALTLYSIDASLIEENANKYLEQLNQRSLVCVSKRSTSGIIKSCRVPPIIHEFVIKQSQKDGFLVANPDQEEIESLLRVAIHHDNKKQYTEVKNNHIFSFLAFNSDKNVLGSAVFLRVLELRKSTILVTTLPNMICLRYLGLRGSNVSELPKNIGDMKNLETLDCRDTPIKTLPQSLWNISKLRHVYVEPYPQIKGPPSDAKIHDLHILKTVGIPKSWLEKVPYFLIGLRKLAFSNWNNLDMKSISNLLSRMDKLLSMTITGRIIPSEFVDLRAFPNFETVTSIKLEGKWICRKLFIDYVQFPPNLAKLTLTNSGLKEDPMPTLEKLPALKFLTLQDEAYTGKQMVCSKEGFPQLQVLKLKKLKNLENWLCGGVFQQLQLLKLKKLENLKNWEVQPSAISKHTTLRVVQCGKLNYPSNMSDVIIEMIEMLLSVSSPDSLIKYWCFMYVVLSVSVF